jgi:acyl-CoA reductase-like NAD-dependent aldehyde dehydrogenase
LIDPGAYGKRVCHQQLTRWFLRKTAILVEGGESGRFNRNDAFHKSCDRRGFTVLPDSHQDPDRANAVPRPEKFFKLARRAYSKKTDLMKKAAGYLRKNKSSLAEIITCEMGKPIRDFHLAASSVPDMDGSCPNSEYANL